MSRETSWDSVVSVGEERFMLYFLHFGNSEGLQLPYMKANKELLPSVQPGARTLQVDAEKQTERTVGERRDI